ncbi:uncharacterized protein CLUP02_05785 [Colletotrichum lupini]|uniref:Uncharacterized protein n=1 Tax=Colletotrichum lupini TaxID=145971 RepID=A0A9Q8WEY2_9PEZI|nr:uncharacterized protein CLUP02_05785 [Colletotrichum lupini]UQC80302.1 hypothetical protein CLUP02_05785 [Colletotrichum lupini]
MRIQTIRTPVQVRDHITSRGSIKQETRTILRTNSSIREIMDENWLV